MADQAMMDAVLAVLAAAEPGGATAYEVSRQLPPGPVHPSHLLVGKTPQCATAGEALSLLRALARLGMARVDESGRVHRWHLTPAGLPLPPHSRI